ncbi:hypothetical protein OAB57_00805 [Bacteriovoracaceae bacterium]|nr:hypothetical protein [Bacteriovoracaceae bacterium]
MLKMIIVCLLCVSAFAKEKEIVKYRKYELLDFNNLDVAGDNGFHSDLPIPPEETGGVKTVLPLKNDFSNEIINDVFEIL